MLLNPDVVVIALLLRFPLLAPLSVLLKIYAAVPLAMTKRWRALAAGVALCLLSAPLWPTFVAQRDTISASLAAQSFSGLSAWGSWLMLPTVVALLAVWRRGAAWLAVPAVWPFTQLHYAALALPVAARNPLVAFLLCFPVAFLPAVATIAYAVGVLLSDQLAAIRASRTAVTTPAP